MKLLLYGVIISILMLGSVRDADSVGMYEWGDECVWRAVSVRHEVLGGEVVAMTVRFERVVRRGASY